MASLAEIRAKLKEQETRLGGGSQGGDNAIYAFWNMEEGKQATLRFLPDNDQDNTFFWTERLMIKLPFSGVKGQTDSRPVQVQVPCMEMANHVLSYKKFAVGLKTQVLKIWVVSIGKSVRMYFKAL